MPLRTPELSAPGGYPSWCGGFALAGSWTSATHAAREVIRIWFRRLLAVFGSTSSRPAAPSSMACGYGCQGQALVRRIKLNRPIGCAFHWVMRHRRSLVHRRFRAARSRCQVGERRAQLRCPGKRVRLRLHCRSPFECWAEIGAQVRRICGPEAQSVSCAVSAGRYLRAPRRGGCSMSSVFHDVVASADGQADDRLRRAPLFGSGKGSTAEAGL